MSERFVVGVTTTRPAEPDGIRPVPAAVRSFASVLRALRPPSLLVGLTFRLASTASFSGICVECLWYHHAGSSDNLRGYGVPRLPTINPNPKRNRPLFCPNSRSRLRMQSWRLSLRAGRQRYTQSRGLTANRLTLSTTSDKTGTRLKGDPHYRGDPDVVDQMLVRSDETLVRHADLFPWERTLQWFQPRRGAFQTWTN